MRAAPGREDGIVVIIISVLAFMEIEPAHEAIILSLFLLRRFVERLDRSLT